MSASVLVYVPYLKNSCVGRAGGKAIAKGGVRSSFLFSPLREQEGRDNGLEGGML